MHACAPRGGCVCAHVNTRVWCWCPGPSVLGAERWPPLSSVVSCVGGPAGLKPSTLDRACGSHLCCFVEKSFCEWGLFLVTGNEVRLNVDGFL